LVELFVKTFRRDFFKRLCGVFKLPSLNHTRKRDETKKAEGKLTSNFCRNFGVRLFDMDFLQKHLHGVFELPLLPRWVLGAECHWPLDWLVFRVWFCCCLVLVCSY
jgi:hypothetical protein